MDWTLFWQIVIPIIASIVIYAVFYYLSHREKVELKYPNMVVQLKADDATGIQLNYSFSLIYIRGTRERYISEIWLELDKGTWEKLKPYSEIYLRMSRGFSLDESGLHKLEVGKPEWFGDDYFFPMRRSVAKEKIKELDDLVQELWHKYKIGWRDTYGKSQSKTINQLRDIKKSFKKAM